MKGTCVQDDSSGQSFVLLRHSLAVAILVVPA